MIGEFILAASNGEGTRQGVLASRKIGPAKLPLQRVVLKASRVTDVQVVGRDGKPVAGATVEICFWGCTACHISTRSVTTNAQGRARVPVPGRRQTRVDRGVQGRDRNGLRLLLRKSLAYCCLRTIPTRTGKAGSQGCHAGQRALADSAGNAVSGLKVAPWQFKKGKHAMFCARTAFHWAVSDGRGRVHFDWLPADVERNIAFSVREGDYSYNATAKLSHEGDGGLSFDIELPAAPARVGGKVTYSDGKPAAGIVIEAEGMGSSQCNRYWARTDEDGHYRLKVGSNGSYIIAVADDQWAATSHLGIILKPGERREDLDFRLKRGTLIHGTVSGGKEPSAEEAWQADLCLAWTGGPQRVEVVPLRITLRFRA